jgi:hypothetical protein
MKTTTMKIKVGALAKASIEVSAKAVETEAATGKLNLKVHVRAGNFPLFFLARW